MDSQNVISNNKLSNDKCDTYSSLGKYVMGLLIISCILIIGFSMIIILYPEKTTFRDIAGADPIKFALISGIIALLHLGYLIYLTYNSKCDPAVSFIFHPVIFIYVTILIIAVYAPMFIALNHIVSYPLSMLF